MTGYVFHSPPTKRLPLRTWIEPIVFVPAVPLFVVPDDCPFEVEEELFRAFFLLWSDESACANSIRCLIETILTDVGIKRYNKRPGKSMLRLKLYDRIGILEQKKPEVAKHMTAIRFIGNEGSHGDVSNLDRELLFHAFQLVELILLELYSTEIAYTLAVRDQIIKSKRV